MIVVKKTILIIGYLLNFLIVNAQLGDSLHLDPTIRYGQLPNGITYYIKNIDTGRENIKMRLYVKAGIFNEGIDQGDFAHAIEHLAFKCAKHYPINLLDDPKLLVQMGMKKGDIFGQTEQFCTWYSFDVPINRIDALEKGLLWFHDILDLKLNPDIINKERGPLRQEIIYRNGDNLERYFLKNRLNSAIFPYFRDNFNFFEHNNSFPTDSLVKFYKDWYVPKNMALVVIGKIGNMDEVELMVKQRFSDTNVQKSSINRQDCRNEYLRRPNTFVVLKRPEKINGKDDDLVEFALYFRDSSTITDRNTWNGLQREIIWGIIKKILNKRLEDASKIYNTSFFAVMNEPTQNLPAFVLHITTKNGMEMEALSKALRIIQQVKIYGLTMEEWEQAQKEQLVTINMGTMTSEYWNVHIKNHFIYGTAFPGNMTRKLSKWLSNLSFKDFNAVLPRYISDVPNDIGLVIPSGQQSRLFIEDKIRHWIINAQTKIIEPYVVPSKSYELESNRELSKLKKAGYTDLKIKSSTFLKDKKTGISNSIREILLDNGLKVVLNTSNPVVDKKNGRIKLHGYSPYGASCFSKENYFSAINATAIVQNSGIGKMDKFQLAGFLDGTSLGRGIDPYINYRETGIKGSSNIYDFEKLLQLVYLYFTEPRNDRLAFEDWKLWEKRKYLNPTFSLIPEDFAVGIREYLGDSSVTPLGTKRFKGLKVTEMRTAYRIYQQLYGQASNFTFLITGRFSEDTVIPLLQKYLGNLPNIGNTLQCSSQKIKERPPGPLYNIIPVQESAPYSLKSVPYSLMFIENDYNTLDWKEHIKMDVLGILMNSKIQELRYTEESALYNMRALANFDKETLTYTFEIYLDCFPEELETLRNLCNRLISEVKKNSSSPERFENIKPFIYRKYSANGESQNKTMQVLYDYYKYNDPWIEKSEIENFVRSLSVKDISETARKYLKDENKLEFVMRDNIGFPYYYTNYFAN